MFNVLGVKPNIRYNKKFVLNKGLGDKNVIYYQK
jgi:hypothetical protein